MANSDEIERMRRKMQAIQDAVAGTRAPTLQGAAARIVALMQQLAPVYKEEAHGDAPGSLRDSIVATPDGDAVKITAGNDEVGYARYVEFGTTKMAPEPFFYPAIRVLKASTKAQVRAAFSAAIRQAWGRQ